MVYLDWTVSPVPGLSIVPADNNPNWEDAPTTNPNTNLMSNKSISSTCLWSKHCQSDNTNEQLANLVNLLIH